MTIKNHNRFGNIISKHMEKMTMYEISVLCPKFKVMNIALE